jgi:hypothetical protein
MKANEVQPNEIGGEDRPAEPGDLNDISLLSVALVRWAIGDWKGLIEIDQDDINDHPNRAYIALFVAIAHLQCGVSSGAMTFIRLAHSWGVSERNIVRALVSGVHNSLGRARSMMTDTATAIEHFEESLLAFNPGSAHLLLSEARVKHQLAQLGIAFDGDFEASSQRQDVARSGAADLDRYSHSAYEYHLAASGVVQPEQGYLITLDCKSLPRSGVHYMKRTLSKILGENFSFCEWYQERGCCRKMPCELTAFSEHFKRRRECGVRLIKSHDFDGQDPDFSALRNVRRVILIRNPLHILTSWFALEQLRAHQDALREKGIKMEKIWLLHEAPIVDAAFDALDRSFREPTAAQFDAWLREKSKYIVRFMNKWVVPAVTLRPKYSYLVRYEEINSFVYAVVNEMLRGTSEEHRAQIFYDLNRSSEAFRVREDPFYTKSTRLTFFMRENSREFFSVTNDILGVCPAGIFDPSAGSHEWSA